MDATESEHLYTEVFDKYTRHVNPYLAKLMGFAGFGVEIRGEGSYLYDHEGRAFLDCLGGYGTFALGHRHPEVLAAVRAQLDSLCISGKAFFSKNQADLAEVLAEVSPAGLEYVFFSNSGAEAVEAALKMAKGATGRPGIVSTQRAYHGKTLGALATAGLEKYRKPFVPLLPGVEFVPYGDSAAAVGAINSDTAAMIIEPIQGEGGINVPPDGYLRDLRAACDRAGALLIMDEVQTGMGRTGTLFACEHDGVAPDLMCLAKALGGGIMPIGATLGTAAVWEAVFSVNPVAHSSTFGGNPLACAAGLATMRVMRRDRLWEASAERGKQMLEGFQAIARQHPGLVADVRGRGLMVGIEFAMDEVGELTVAQMLKRGICVAYALNNPRVLRFEPPLTMTADEVDQVIAGTAGAIAETEEVLAMLA